MINNKKVAVVLPAYNAEKTLERTVQEIPASVDLCILVDDGSTDDTVGLARRLGLPFELTLQVLQPEPKCREGCAQLV